MNTIKNIVILIAGVLIVFFITDSFATKYNTNSMGLSCINDDVANTLLEVTTKDLKDQLFTQGFILSSKVIKENTATESKQNTINAKAKYTCNTSIKLTLEADLKNRKAVEYIKSISNNGKSFSNNIDRKYTITENDLGTLYWVNSIKITTEDLNSLIN